MFKYTMQSDYQDSDNKLRQLSVHTPPWLPALHCKNRLQQFFDRTANQLSPRLPLHQLAVAMLGGTGTGKSTLLNALIGENVVAEGKERPTTHQPLLVCHTNADVSVFSGFHILRLNNPLLENLILIDCPDPDTSETAALDSNLALLRAALPYCDVIIVTATQQKYRSKCVLDELADAAAGARLVFVQTHAGKDTDIREDWKNVLQDRYETGQMYYVDSKTDDGTLQALRQLLTKDLTGEIARRIRQANYYGLAEEAVGDCNKIVETNWSSVQKLRDKIIAERRSFGTKQAEKIQHDLQSDRQIWEAKLIARVSSHWGYSPFSLLLRLYQGLGSLLSGAILTRVRSPIQLAVWGTFEGVRQIRKRKMKKKPLVPPLSVDEKNRLKEAGIILTGFADDAQLPVTNCSSAVIDKEAEEMQAAVLAEIAAELDDVINRLAEKHDRWRFRLTYETLFSAMLLFLLARPAKNFFYDSFLANAPLLGLDYYIVSLFWLTAWSAVLLFFFTFSLRKDIVKTIQETASNWNRLPTLDKLFSAVEQDTKHLIVFRNDLATIKRQFDSIKSQAEKIDHRLGYRKGDKKPVP